MILGCKLTVHKSCKNHIVNACFNVGEIEITGKIADRDPEQQIKELSSIIDTIEKELEIEENINKTLKRIQISNQNLNLSDISSKMKESTYRLVSLNQGIQKRNKQLELLSGKSAQTDQTDQVDITSADTLNESGLEQLEEIMNEIIDSELRYSEDMKLTVKVFHII